MVFGLLDRGNETTPGVTAPRVTLSFGAGGGGFLDGLVPDASGSAGLADGLLSLTLDRGFAPHVDWADIQILPPDGADLPAIDASGSLTITVGTRSVTFDGTLASITHDIDGTVRLGMTNGSHVLAQSRGSAVFSEQSASDIISALCAEAGVESETSGGPSLPRYFADGGPSALDHIARLAASMGRLAYVASNGRLTLIDDASPGEEIPIAAGDAIVAAQFTERTRGANVHITGAGAQDWAWLRKDPGPIQAEAGDASFRREKTAPWLRDASAVGDYAQARGRAVGRDAAPGEITLAAYPDAQPGTVLAVSGTAQDGPWRVMRSRLHLSPAGYRNVVSVAKADADAGALGLLGSFL